MRGRSRCLGSAAWLRWAPLGLGLVGWSCQVVAPREPFPLGFGAVTAGPGYRAVDLGVVSDDGAVLAARLCLPAAEGTYPAVVFHFGSDRWQRLTCEQTVGWLAIGMAAVTYDKRGTGRSQGKCCPYHDSDFFLKMGADVAALARATARWPEIAPQGVGAYGFSQGGWVIPVAAARAPDAIRWTIIGSGPAVTVGEELVFSDLTGDTQCKPTGRSPAELERGLTAAGPSGFDPRPYLEKMTRPGLWVFGGLDTSIPVARSVQILEEVRVRHNAPFTIHTIPNINHSWIVDGAMCQLTGNRWDDSQVIVPWLVGIGAVSIAER